MENDPIAVPLHVVEDRLIKIKDVLRICALSRSTIYAEMKTRGFPMQVKLSKRGVAWSLREVMLWVEEHKRLRS